MAHLQLLVQHNFPEYEGSTLFNVNEGDISLGVGAADQQTLIRSREVFALAAAESFTKPLSYSLLQYGPTIGDGGFLTELATFLSRQYANPVLRENLVITSGASFGLSVICQLFMRPGRYVFAADPAYFIARDLLTRDGGLTLVPVPSDDNGMQTDELEKLLSDRVPANTVAADNASSSDLFACLIYVIPTHCNPTSTTLTLERRRKLVELGYKYRALIVCDDVYDMLTFPDQQQPPPRICSLDSGPGCVISNGSFSKIFGPGVRLGWFETHPKLVACISSSGVYYSGGSPNHLMSGIFRTILAQGHEDAVLTDLRKTYAARCNDLCDALTKYMPPTVTFKRPQGGFFLWVRLPENVDAEKVLEISRRDYHVIFQPGNWSSASKLHHNYMRLCFTYNLSPQLVIAAEKLAQAVRQVMNESPAL